MWTYSINLKDAYFHIHIHPKFGRFLRVFFKGKLQGKWEPQEQGLHINILEMRVVAKALVGFSFPLGITVLMSSDNSTVVSYINKECGTRSLSLWKETELVFQLVISLQISIWAVHIPGKMTRPFPQSGHSTTRLGDTYSSFGALPTWTYLQPDGTPSF